MARICCAALFIVALFSGAALAEGLAGVDAERVFREVAPGKAVSSFTPFYRNWTIVADMHWR